MMMKFINCYHAYKPAARVPLDLQGSYIVSIAISRYYLDPATRSVFVYCPSIYSAAIDMRRCSGAMAMHMHDQVAN